MARVIWAEPALQDLDAIADFIALDDPGAAKRQVRTVFERVDQLGEFPVLGSRPKDLRNTPHRRLVVKPILLYYRIAGSRIHIVYVTRGERRFSLERIKEHEI